MEGAEGVMLNKDDFVFEGMKEVPDTFGVKDFKFRITNSSKKELEELFLDEGNDELDYVTIGNDGACIFSFSPSGEERAIYDADLMSLLGMLMMENAGG